MPSFGSRSRRRLEEIHPDLQRILVAAIEEYDFTILCGHRGEAEQNAAFDAGNSKLRYPRSKHNQSPSLAVDIAPWPVDWQDLDRFRELKRIIFTAAHALDIALVWGADWNGDGDETDHQLRDYPHFELG